MGNNQNLKTDYSKLKRKLYIKIVVLSCTAFVIVLVLRLLSRGHIANMIITFMDDYLNVDYQAARIFYLYHIRNNLDFIMIIAVAVFFIFLCKLLLSQFSRYFGEISNGIAILVRDKNDTIRLSPEMAAMERQLQMLQHTLSSRKQAAEIAERRKNDLVMYLVHDIKTPLTSIIGYLNLLDEKQDLSSDQKSKYVQTLLEKAYRLEQLTDELFEISQYNLCSIQLSKQKIDLYYMLVQLLEEFYPQLSQKGQQAVIHADEESTLYADPDKLARVFNNVLKNAISYGNLDSEIDISVESGGNMSVIRFKNSGSIGESYLDLIFDKFYRLDKSRSSNDGGTGLGLAISKEIVSLHEGRIYASSEGGHTTFTVELPTGLGYE